MITDFTWTRYDGTCNKREAITSMMIKKRGNETMKKKVITALTTACLVATLFSGCGQKEVTNGQADNQSNSATADATAVGTIAIDYNKGQAEVTLTGGCKNVVQTDDLNRC